MKTHDILYQRYLSVSLILTGILLGLLLSGLAAWADHEATSYGFTRRAQTPFKGLSCPIFMGRNESRTVSIKVSNPTKQPIYPGISTQISTPHEFDSKIEHIQLEPGQQLTVQRTVGPQNIDLGFFIFVDAQVSAAYPLPARENTCGILVLPVSNGVAALVLGTALSLLFMGSGTFLLYKHGSSSRRPDSILFLVIATIIALIFSFMGWWLQAIVVIVVLVLTLLITLNTFFN